MKEQAAVASASRSAACMVMSRTGVRLFRHLHEHLAVAILLPTFGCLPARCQDAGNLAIRRVREAPAQLFFLYSCVFSCGLGDNQKRSHQWLRGLRGLIRDAKSDGDVFAEIDEASLFQAPSRWFRSGPGIRHNLRLQKEPDRTGFPQIAVQSRRLFGKRAWPSLIVVRMTVAPIPIVLLHSVVLPVVLTITPVLCCQVTPVGVVFVVVPVMVIAVVPIVDADLDAGLLSFGFGHN
jgi:hypothetical protein